MLKSSRVAVLGVVGVVGVLGLAGCASSQVAERTPEANAQLATAAAGAEVVVVAMHADWCGTCTRLGPEVQAAMGQLSDAPVKFVKADLTKKNSPEGRGVLEAMGLSDLHARNGSVTGVLYFVDAESGTVIERMAGVNDAATIEAAARAAVATAS